MKIIDISPGLSPTLAVFPGDMPFKRTIALDFKLGHNLLLSSMEGSLHLGAHTDAPNHYRAGAESIDQRDLRLYLGPVQIVEVSARHADLRLKVADLKDKIVAPRVLFKTKSYPNVAHFNEDFMAFSPELVDFLAEHKVRLIGLDTPSVDPARDQDLLAHARVAHHDMAILEGVVLDEVRPGLYTLIALPLKIMGADASPVRAVLINDGGKSL